MYSILSITLLLTLSITTNLIAADHAVEMQAKKERPRVEETADPLKVAVEECSASQKLVFDALLSLPIETKDGKVGLDMLADSSGKFSSTIASVDVGKISGKVTISIVAARTPDKNSKEEQRSLVNFSIVATPTANIYGSWKFDARARVEPGVFANAELQGSNRIGEFNRLCKRETAEIVKKVVEAREELKEIKKLPGLTTLKVNHLRARSLAGITEVIANGTYVKKTATKTSLEPWNILIQHHPKNPVGNQYHTKVTFGNLEVLR